ncbi:MAG: alpha-ketoglutarate-dependent dioxygenase AlkB [Flammeovirgaceae bacterium]
MKLPLNCEIAYHPNFLEEDEANQLFVELGLLLKEGNYTPQTVEGNTYEVNFGKIMFIDQVLIDENRFPQEHWGPTKVWSKHLKKLKDKIEDFTHQQFHVCVLIHYPDGHSGVDFHSDFPAFGDTSLIPSISLGEEREFQFREKDSGNVFTQTLANGSLVIMGKYCQDRYEHSLPINPRYKNPRINLTFRKLGFDS